MSPPAGPDPVGVVVELVNRADPGSSEVARAVITRVAPVRNTARRLAAALNQRPEVLCDGRSPAPRVVGDLLIALRAAGLTRIHAPVCAGCAKPLKVMARRGQDWFCTGCGAPRARCSACGATAIVSSRDRAGRPRCQPCTRTDGLAATRILIDVITGLDPGIDPVAITVAVEAVTPRASERTKLAWACQDRPDLLTGNGACAPVPSVLRLIDALTGTGTGVITAPACPHCGRVIRLVRPRGGVRLCRNCLARSRAVTCSRCGAHREVATRDPDGQPLCANCLVTDPANLETCTGCGRTRRVSVRTPNGPTCPSCRPTTTSTCSICARSAPCQISRITNQPCCTACTRRRARCVSCGQVRPTPAGTAEEPLCATCARPDPSFWTSCPACGRPRQTNARNCAACDLRHRVTVLLGGGGNPTIRPELAALHDNLVNNDHPDAVRSWLNKPATATILGELGSGTRALTHASLDQLPRSKPVDHLRAVLVATGALPERDEHLIRAEAWLAATISTHPQARLLHRYGSWHLLRRLRARNHGHHATASQAAVLQQQVRAAIRLLDWLTARNLTLAQARPADLDIWATSGQTRHHAEAGHFLRWAKSQKLTTIDFPAARWPGPAGPIDTEARWRHARRLLHDTTVKPGDRFAGLLLLLYAQHPATISRLTLSDLQADGTTVRLRVGRQPIALPEPLADLARTLTTTRTGHAAIGDRGTSPWLFPGGRPGQPISPDRLAERLRQIGLHPAQDRSTALFALAAELPAALLSQLLGIDISVAVRWQQASAGDWTTYAADYARRDPPRPTPEQGYSEPSNI